MKNIVSDNQSEGATLIDYISILLKRWKIITVLFVSIVFFTAIFSFIKRPAYTADVTILPSFETPTGLSGSISQLGEIANQLGLSPSEVSINSPLVYEKMLKSRELIDRVVQRQFRLSEGSAEKALIDIYKIDRGIEPEKRLYQAYRRLLQSMRIKIDNQSMTLTLSIKARNPYLAAAVTNAMVEELDQYNMELRTLKAATNKKFVEGRVYETKEKLRQAEEDLMRFKQENRRIEDSPELSLELGRLMREVKLQEELFITLSREYELAKIQEVKDTPLIYTLGEARPPIEKSSPKRFLNVIVAAIVSLILGIALVYIVEYAQKSGWNRNAIERTEGFRVMSSDVLLFKKVFLNKVRKLARRKDNQKST